MTKVWPIQDAKAKFAEIVRLAGSEGPQILTHRGVETAAVVSIDDLRRIQAAKEPEVNLLLHGPVLEDYIVDAINYRRPAEPWRDVGFGVDWEIDPDK
ncbi:MAG TPA: type II toxin-antitoxin system Phd/YefM family antitoxin [Rhizomicrobium sp.]|nr:type II toxin-antitoxin system Phd/YefM family antitoxin [Rhizomicrobium sp.]